MSERQNKAMKLYDIIIAGGGMAGVTAAMCLSELGFSIALIEAIEPELPDSTSFDQRAVALSASSVEIYKSLGVWSKLLPISCAIKQIQVSDQGQFGSTRLNAKDYYVESLGEVVPLDQAGPLLWNELVGNNNVDIFCPAVVKSVFSQDDACKVKIEIKQSDDLSNNKSKVLTQEIKGQLLIAADGTFSQIAQQLNFKVSRQPYSQHAVIANVTTEMANNNTAYERFTPSGPLALLPLSKHQMSLVWCQKPSQIESVMEWSEEVFVQNLQEAFGLRLGRITKVSQRYEYPLSLHIAEQTHAQRVLLLGNSAHTLHPIAGQGFNLGLRDIAALGEFLEYSVSLGKDIGSVEVLSKFISSRKSDWQQTVLATDSLARLFSNEFLPLVLARNHAMSLVNQFSTLKLMLANAAMGYSGRSSRLARGLKSGSSFQKNAP